MLLLLRKMKQGFFARQEFRRYLIYALGEMALVIIGILIALQIDNWNTEQKQEESLKHYLNSISKNIGNDLMAVRAIRENRETARELSMRMDFLRGKASFDVDEIGFASQALSAAQELHFFKASTSGFEALKSSGNLEQLQGRDIEQLLYDYYDTVDQIEQAEQSHNEFVRLYIPQLINNFPADVSWWEFADPSALAADHFQALQPGFRDLLDGAGTNALYALAASVGELILNYDKLNRLGMAFVRMIENDTMAFDETTIATIDSIYDPSTGAGYPILIANGKISMHTYNWGAASSSDSRLFGRSPDSEIAESSTPFRFNSVERFDDRLQIVYPGGAQWAGVWLRPQDSVSAGRFSLDFSSFDKLQLELKGNIGGEKILVHMKDSNDPDDGSQTDLELQLTDQWQVYEIDLERFENADLDHLHIVLGFLFREEPQAFSVRTAKFVKTD